MAEYFVEVTAIFGVKVSADCALDACRFAGKVVHAQLGTDDIEVIDVEPHLDEIEQVGELPQVVFLAPSWRDS